jgi:hypothetical protein
VLDVGVVTEVLEEEEEVVVVVDDDDDDDVGSVLEVAFRMGVEVADDELPPRPPSRLVKSPTRFCKENHGFKH